VVVFVPDPVSAIVVVISTVFILVAVGTVETAAEMFVPVVELIVAVVIVFVPVPVSEIVVVISTVFITVVAASAVTVSGKSVPDDVAIVDAVAFTEIPWPSAVVAVIVPVASGGAVVASVGVGCATQTLHITGQSFWKTSPKKGFLQSSVLLHVCALVSLQFWTTDDEVAAVAVVFGSSNVVTVIGLDCCCVVGALVGDTTAVESSFASVVVGLEQFATLQLTGQSDLTIAMLQSRRPIIVNVAHAGVSTHGTNSSVVLVAVGTVEMAADRMFVPVVEPIVAVVMVFVPVPVSAIVVVISTVFILVAVGTVEMAADRMFVPAGYEFLSGLSRIIEPNPMMIFFSKRPAASSPMMIVSPIRKPSLVSTSSVVAPANVSTCNLAKGGFVAGVVISAVVVSLACVSLGKVCVNKVALVFVSAVVVVETDAVVLLGAMLLIVVVEVTLVL
jgi:hypothetical protein